MAASFLTLFVVKGVYYELYIAKHEWFLTKIKRKSQENSARKIRSRNQ
jgi:hypothetical protein